MKHHPLIKRKFHEDYNKTITSNYEQKILLKKELQYLYNECHTLRELLFNHEFEECCIRNDDVCIKNCMRGKYRDLVEKWADNNDTSYASMFHFIVNHLDDKVDYHVNIDPSTINIINNNLECVCNGIATIDNVELDMTIWKTYINL